MQNLLLLTLESINISISILTRRAFRTACTSKNTLTLNKILYRAQNSPGKRDLPSKKQETALSKCGRSESLKINVSIQGRFRIARRIISNHGRTTGDENKTPWAHTFRQFSAENRKIPLRNTPNKAQTNIDAQNAEHVSTM